MGSAGEGLKCHRVVHNVGREPEVRERECTPKEVAEKKVEIERAKGTQNQLVEWGKFMEPYTRLMERCYKRFGAMCDRR